MTDPAIFEFARFSDYFSALCRRRKQFDGTFSYRKLGRIAGIRSPSLLAMIAAGTRTPTQGCLLKLTRALKLKKAEAAYALALAGLERADTEEERSHFQRQLVALRPSSVAPKTLLDLDAFELISRWHHLAILEMTELADFESDPHWISRRLGGEVGVRDVEEALDRLLRLGLLDPDESGRLRKRSGGIETPRGVSSEAIRKFHRSQLQNASHALEEQAVSERYFHGHTVSIDPVRLAEIEKLFLQFIRKVDALCEPGEKTETYHLGFQAFRLTRDVKEKDHA